jgi:hypothetical protein
MKITKRQLRKLIRETLDTTWPARSRKFSRSGRKLVREMGREARSLENLQLMAQDIVSGASDDYDADEELLPWEDESYGYDAHEERLPWEDESHGRDLEYLATDSYAIRQALMSAGWPNDAIDYFLELDQEQRLQWLEGAAGEV